MPARYPERIVCLTEESTETLYLLGEERRIGVLYLDSKEKGSLLSGSTRAALETLAVVAYLGPCSRPEIARIRGVAADSAVASLVERGLICEAGRDDGPAGAVRYRTTPLFERVFALDSLAALPRLDDVGPDVDGIRERLLAVAEARAS